MFWPMPLLPKPYCKHCEAVKVAAKAALNLLEPLRAGSDERVVAVADQLRAALSTRCEVRP